MSELQTVGKKRSTTTGKEERKKTKSRESEDEKGKEEGREVHLGSLLVIFHPDLFVSPAPACLPSTTCFLLVPADLVSPRQRTPPLFSFIAFHLVSTSSSFSVF